MSLAACGISYHFGELPRLHFWRDHRSNEVDLVVDTPNDAHPVEITSGETIRTDLCRGLAYWASRSGQTSATGHVVAAGAQRKAAYFAPSSKST